MLVFLAISYCLAGNATTGESWRARMGGSSRAMVSMVSQDPSCKAGNFIICKSSMKSPSQFLERQPTCIRATIAFFFANLAMMVSPWAPVALLILVPSYVTFSSMMACRIFRGVALGIIDDSALTTTNIAAVFRSAPPVSRVESTFDKTLQV